MPSRLAFLRLAPSVAHKTIVSHACGPRPPSLRRRFERIEMNLQFPSRQTAANDRIWHCIADCFNRPVTAFYPFMPTISPVGFGPLGLSTALLAIRLAEEFV